MDDKRKIVSFVVTASFVTDDGKTHSETFSSDGRSVISFGYDNNLCFEENQRVVIGRSFVVFGKTSAQ